MSRRPPNPAADRAAQNQQTLKTLVKLEANKSCADCKRNRHPRWASWNLGIFICIRCSGIHRGMGTHISRVKSVDLDSWTDEQLQSMLRWGNSRANKYWEAKLAVGHVPAEAKIENFIRTKYDSKRWVLEGPMPDPATLDADGDDEVPLNFVQERAKLDRSASLRGSSTSTQPPPITKQHNADVDLFGDDSTPVSARSSSVAADPGSPRPPPKDIPAPKPTKPAESLLGLDCFDGSQSNAPARPSSTTPTINSSSGLSRPDLKQSILSLYASPSRTSTPSQLQQPDTVPLTSAIQPTPAPSTVAGLDNAFGKLTFPPLATTRSVPPEKSSVLPVSTSPVPQMATPVVSTIIASGSMGKGSFFNSKPTIKPQSNISSSSRPPIPRGKNSSNGFGNFTSVTPAAAAAPTQMSSGNGLVNLLDFSSPSEIKSAQDISAYPPSSQQLHPPNSAFNLSTGQSAQPVPPSTTSFAKVGNSLGYMSMDPWGSADPWASLSISTAPSNPPLRSAPTHSPTNAEWEWGDSGGDAESSRAKFVTASSAPQVLADEDFGGWESSTTQVPTRVESAKPPRTAGGLNGSDDLFSNVWE